MSSVPGDLLTSHTGEPLSASLYAACKPHFGGTVLREILQAQAGMKVSRVVVTAPQAAVLQRLAGQFGFSATKGTRLYRLVEDAGKGRFSNQSLVATRDPASGTAFLYIARTPDLAEAARDMEEVDDSDGFGALLGIPACCRKAYRRFRSQARTTQGDLLPQVWANTARDRPFDPWLNVAVRYFGACLISFFPCSFHCAAARVEAQRAYRVISGCDNDWARSFLRAHDSNVLYTDTHGVYQFKNRMTEDVIPYGADTLASTGDTGIGRLLRRGNRLRVLGPHHVAVECEEASVGSISGGALRVCVFAA
jgi:hypothetical protein